MITRTIAEQINRAFRNTDPAHIARLLERYNPNPNAPGAIFIEKQTPESLCAAQWQPYNNPEIQAPTQAFKALIAGNLRVASLVDLRGDLVLEGCAESGMFKVVDLTPKISMPVKHTTLIIGPPQVENPSETTRLEPTVLSIHPGEQIWEPSVCKLGGQYKHGDQITVKAAWNLGFQSAKLQNWQ